MILKVLVLSSIHYCSLGSGLCCSVLYQVLPELNIAFNLTPPPPAAALLLHQTEAVGDSPHPPPRPTFPTQGLDDRAPPLSEGLDTPL